MHIFLLGGTGFIGRHLSHYLVQEGHTLSVLSRHAQPKGVPDAARIVSGDPLQAGEWVQEAAQADALINLVGRNIMARWTEKVKQEILESRVLATRMAVQAVQEAQENKPALINANAVGFYPFSQTEVFDETGPAGDHFLARVCVAWQREALRAQELGARVVVARFAPVLAADEGMLQSILPVFRKGLGGRIGTGTQPFPWIHVHDLVRAIAFCAQTPSVQGVVNVCAPEHITNDQFTRALGRALNRPTLLPVPGAALRLRFGELAEMLRQGQFVDPAVLKAHHFAFQYPHIQTALQDITAQTT